MSSLGGAQRGRQYWRSLDQVADSPEFRAFVEAEFPNFAAELLTSPSRRQFLKIMGASLALGGLTGCRWPREVIVPYTDRPRGRTPGETVQYATTMELGAVGTGLLVTSYDGRPIKIEGNEKHPLSLGKSSAIQQASLLDLYDPDRSKSPVRRTGGRGEFVGWREFEAFAGPHFAALRERGGAGLCVLAEPSGSPTRADLRGRFQRAFPQARWYEYEPLSRDHEREGSRLVFGQALRTHLHLDQADVIVSFGADFLADHPTSIRAAREFAARRRADDGRMNRLWVFESDVSLTGTAADHRFPVRAGQLGALLWNLWQNLGGEAAHPAPPPGVPAAAWTRLVEDLRGHGGRSVVLVGPHLPPEVHALQHHVNAALGAVGQTVSYTQSLDPQRPTHFAQMQSLTEQMRAGTLDTLLILGGNPAYDAPAQLDFAALLPQVKNVIRAGQYLDETSARSAWHVPVAHYLESWGDARAWDGTVSLVQPLIEPLYEGRTIDELLALLSGDALTRAYDLVRRTFAEQFAGDGDFEATWHRALHDGVVAESQWPPMQPALQPGTAVEPPAGRAADIELLLRRDYKVHDGRFANNGWLQELPDPVTKLTWDNAALLAPADAERLGVRKYGDLVQIEVQGHTLRVPAYPLPGHAEGCVTLPVGYGRRQAGDVADGAGFDAYPLLRDALGYTVAVKLSRAAGHRALATTQDHHTIRSAVGEDETARRVEHELVRCASLAQYRQDPNFAQQGHHRLQLWQPWPYDQGHQWGMAIDLSACIGCSACVVACQAENNIPVVGKDEVARGREMHWIRVDRYFTVKQEPAAEHADAAPHPWDADVPGAAVEVVHQPMLCVHCENAPCEQVCPVNATVHDTEGLNVQVYNRCIGTRYCNNNCPFKVRRFNWFWNHHGPRHPRSGKDLLEVERMVFNPDVTVRSRGVMEKCMFCVQRINQAKFKAKREGWPAIPDETFTTACAQACPTDAIVFGDLADPQSRVRQLHEHNRAYELLEELNLRTRLHYLAKLRNPAFGAEALPDETGHPQSGST